MLQEKLLAVFDKLEIDSRLINENTHLSDELGMDSQEFIELFCLLDKEFQINFPSDRIAHVKTFGNLMSIVNQCQNSENLSIYHH